MHALKIFKKYTFLKFYNFHSINMVLLILFVQAPVKGSEDPYDPNNFDEYYSDEYGGYGNPAGGGGMRGGNMNRGPPGPGRFQGGGGPMNNRGM